MCSLIFLIVLIYSTVIVTVNGSPFRPHRNFTKGSPDITFPENNYRTVPLEVSLRIQGVPKCANGVTFCENFNPYPVKKIQRILEKSSIYNDFWTKDDEEIEFGERNEEENFVCAAIQRTIFPNVAINKDNKWKYIVNMPEGYFKQGITIETCRTPGGACKIFNEMPNGYVTYCKQKYVYRRLISLSETGFAAVDTFQLPSACCCAYRRNYDFLQRIRN